ncbi:hypothetical protein N6L24_07940 [Cognatishimia sp. SS12]|uniref:hypothetical protein n=1 Tax=Cognatishimia sp. SS12 TaxID=2979465 RepID=UPI00232C3D8B|nr:hypothetical protein [Cognatishimia sp. SS12]MDC0738207.1 hypothetical protein [Cognatishimia sp. SS12]
MHKWFKSKLDEMIGLSQYCDFPLLQAHFVLTRAAVDELYDSSKSENESLRRMLPLLIEQANSKNRPDVAQHLSHALQALGPSEEVAANVVRVDFDVLRTPQVDLKSN